MQMHSSSYPQNNFINTKSATSYSLIKSWIIHDCNKSDSSERCALLSEPSACKEAKGGNRAGAVGRAGVGNPAIRGKSSKCGRPGVKRLNSVWENSSPDPCGAESIQTTGFDAEGKL